MLRVLGYRYSLRHVRVHAREGQSVADDLELIGEPDGDWEPRYLLLRAHEEERSRDFHSIMDMVLGQADIHFWDAKQSVKGKEWHEAIVAYGAAMRSLEELLKMLKTTQIALIDHKQNSPTKPFHPKV